MPWSWPRAGRLAFAVAAAGMIVTPLRPRGRRAVLADVVVAGFAGSTFASSIARWGGPRTLVGFATIAGGATAVEVAGSRTGRPFGRYCYTGSLRPQVAGVPLAVPLAWFAMGLPARETAHAALGRRSTVAGRVVLGAACLTAWDLFLDPQMTGEGHWVWARPGRYRGIPATNFAGWFLTGLGLMVVLEVVLPVPADTAPVGGAVGVYGWMAVMQTLGFAAFFRDPLVATAGGAAMVPIAVLAARRTFLGGFDRG